ncbi:MAG: DUF4091 domain-containing protein [Armatimonadota bacterium]|nr:DUF4091 domain-containing protein [Armatimonadota bacterium]
MKILAVGAGALGSLTNPTGVNATPKAPSRGGKPVEKDGVEFWLETSLRRVFPNSPPGSAMPLRILAARNETISFQACFRNLKTSSIQVTASVEGADNWGIRIRQVGFVPLRQMNTDVPTDEVDGIGFLPGLVPDPLYPGEALHIGPQANGAFWINLAIPADAKVGVHRLSVRLTVRDEFSFPVWKGIKPWSISLPVLVEVCPIAVHKRKDFPVTHWINIESIWDYYKIEPYSDRFWELAEAYITNLVDHGTNVIYSPIFNNRHEIIPRPAQLLMVRRTADGYEFDFRDVRRWIRLALAKGADYLEWTHFFTPAPTSARHPQRIWERWDNMGEMLWQPDISATSDTYRKFLSQFLPQFRQVLEEEKVLERSFFHCADEPDGDVQIEDYRKARTLLKELAPWIKVIDAMSDPRFATNRLADIPVPSIVTAPLFEKAGCPAWTYFCCGPRGRFLQRLHDTPLPKIRMSGWLFYKLRAKGFLHWGYNYWYVFCTGTMGDPFNDPANGAWPGLPYGDPFVVYPGKNEPIDSIRWEVFAESLQDYALLQSAGISPDDPLFNEIESYETFPKTEEWIITIRENILRTCK